MGFRVGSAAMVIPMYITETASTNVCGRMIGPKTMSIKPFRTELARPLLMSPMARRRQVHGKSMGHKSCIEGIFNPLSAHRGKPPFFLFAYIVYEYRPE